MGTAFYPWSFSYCLPEMLTYLYSRYFFLKFPLHQKSLPVYKMCLVFCKFLKLYLPETVSFPLYLPSCLSHYPINLSSYLSNLLHQEVLWRSSIWIMIRGVWPMLYFRTYWLYNACRIYWLMLGQWYGYKMLRLHIVMQLDHRLRQ